MSPDFGRIGDGGGVAGDVGVVGGVGGDGGGGGVAGGAGEVGGVDKGCAVGGEAFDEAASGRCPGLGSARRRLGVVGRVAAKRLPVRKAASAVTARAVAVRWPEPAKVRKTVFRAGVEPGEEGVGGLRRRGWGRRLFGVPVRVVEVVVPAT